MTTLSYVDAEDLVKSWLLSTSVSPLANNKIFLAMPDGSPNPSVVLTRVGGGPTQGGDIPEDVARISFAVWGSSRPQAKAIAKALVSECESLALTGGFTSSDGRLHVAETVNWLWLPDGKTARYVVDVLFTVTGL